MKRSQNKSIQKIQIIAYRKVIANRFLSSLIKVFHPELGSIVEFAKYAARKVRKNEKILDAGAGSQNYRIFFRHCRYEATDFCEVNKLYENQDSLSFICDLQKIPKKDNTYDAILNIQVLEHVKNPQKVVNEFYRILKKGGKLFLTVPQGWPLHDEPHHYFNFTCYGLKELFENAGFRIKFIKPRGGYFHYLTITLHEIPLNFLKNSFNPLKFIVAIPLLIITTILFYFITPPICYVFDYIFDKDKKHTLGYACYCVKE